MNSSFWAGFEKRAIWGAGAVHVLQNMGMKKLLSSVDFGKSIGHHFTSSLLGRQPGRVSSFLRGATSGATIPELELLRTHAADLGAKVREGLRQHGVRHLTPQDLAHMQGLLAAGPKAIADSTSIHAKVLQSHLSSHPMFSALKGALPDVDKMYHSPEHPLLSNIAKNLVQPPKGMAAAHVLPGATAPGHSSLAGTLTGAAATGILDPATGIMNTSKVLSSHPTSRSWLERSDLGRRALGWVDKTFVNAPTQHAYAQGQAGQQLSSVAHKAKEVLFNPVVASAEQTAHAAGQLSRQLPISARGPVPAVHAATASVPGMAKAAHIRAGFEKASALEKRAGNPLVSAMPGIRSGIKKLEQGGTAAAASPTTGVAIAARSTAPKLPIPSPVDVKHNLSATKPPVRVPKVSVPKQSGRGISSVAL